MVNRQVWEVQDFKDMEGDEKIQLKTYKPVMEPHQVCSQIICCGGLSNFSIHGRPICGPTTCN